MAKTILLWLINVNTLTWHFRNGLESGRWIRIDAPIN